MTSFRKYRGFPFTINEQGKVIPQMDLDEFEELYLHAYKYKFDKYVFKTPHPHWAVLPLEKYMEFYKETTEFTGEIGAK